MCKSVVELSKFGLGKKCLIVAGGTSVKKFRFDKVPEDFIIFGINFQFPEMLKHWNKKFHFRLYTDKSFSDLSQYMDFEDSILIGHKPTRSNDANLLSPKAQYWFNETVIQTERDSCYYAINICHDIMKFDKIYVIGLDGYAVNGIYHYWHDKFILNDTEYKIHPNEKKMMDKCQFERMLKYYYELVNYHNVYNCNFKSKIKTFYFKTPWGDE